MNRAISYRWLVAGLLLMLLSRFSLAQTSEPSPENPFGHLSRAGVVPASKGMYEAIAKVEESLQELTKKLSKDSTPSGKEMAKLYLLVGQLNRWVAFLDHYREPAVVDWKLRSNFYLKMLLEIRNRYYASPAAARDQAQVLKQLRNGQPARMKAYAKTMQTLQSGEAKQAENQIEKIQTEILSISGVLGDPDKKPFYEPMHEVVGAVNGPMSQFRNRETAEAEQTELAKLDELMETLLATLANGNGVEGLTTAANQWKLAHLQRLRVHAFTHAGGSRGISGTGLSAPGGQPAASENQDDGMAKVKSAFVDYVARQSSNAAPPNGLDHYLAIQQVLAELTIMANDTTWTSALDRSLEGLAKKCQISADTYNYRLATDELLFWRQRTATEWAESLPGETIGAVARKELASTDSYVGLYEKNQQSVLPVVLKPIPDIVPDVQQRMSGKMVKTTAVVPLSGSTTSGWITRADEGFYCKLEQNGLRDVVAPILRKELLCEGDAKPLSLQSAAAILSAEMGLSEEVGGTLGKFVIESYVSRMCNIPEPHGNLIALGSLGTELSGDCRRCLLLQWDIQPSWMKHKYMIYRAPKR